MDDTTRRSRLSHRNALKEAKSTARRSPAGTLSCFLFQFFVRPESRFFVPTCPQSVTPRADAVKDGRRSVPAAHSALDRPLLDGGEHGVMLQPVGVSAAAPRFNGCYPLNAYSALPVARNPDLGSSPGPALPRKRGATAYD
jgi:hypothetical protein